MVAHFWEEHDGRRQDVLMRITSTHSTPLERQVQESCNILKANSKQDECLNRKSEWKEKNQGNEDEIMAINILREVGNKGQKRVCYLGDDSQ